MYITHRSILLLISIPYLSYISCWLHFLHCPLFLLLPECIYIYIYTHQSRFKCEELQENATEQSDLLSTVSALSRNSSLSPLALLRSNLYLFHFEKIRRDITLRGWETNGHVFTSLYFKSSLVTRKQCGGGCNVGRSAYLIPFRPMSRVPRRDVSPWSFLALLLLCDRGPPTRRHVSTLRRASVSSMRAAPHRVEHVA